MIMKGIFHHLHLFRNFRKVGGSGKYVLASERKYQQESVGEEVIHYHRGMDGVCIHSLCQAKGGDERGYDTVMSLNGSPEIFNPASNVQILFLRKASLRPIIEFCI